jgi:hypothetical protein
VDGVGGRCGRHATSGVAAARVCLDLDTRDVISDEYRIRYEPLTSS